MGEMLMEAVLLWSLQKGCLVVQVDLESLVAEVLLQGQVVALIVELMDIGLETVKLGTGKTSVTAVETEVI